MTAQLESRHFFRAQDTVEHRDGRIGTVLDAYALFATVHWRDGRRDEIDQFDPTVVVIERAHGP